MLGEISALEFIQQNWVAIVAAIGAAVTALATGAVYCVRAVWFHALKPLVEWLRDKAEDFLASHKSFLNGIDAKVGIVADAQEKISGQIGSKFEQHKVALTHTADGLIAHVDGGR